MIDMNDVKRLLTETDDRTLTLYINVDNARPENQAAQSAWKIEVKNTLETLERGLTDDEQQAWPFVREWVSDFTRSYAPEGKTLVIFAGPSFQNTFELPFSVGDEIQVFFGRPQVGPLLWLIDEYEPYLVVMADQERAKFFSAYLGTMGFQGDFESDVQEYDFAERTTMHAPGSGIDNAAVHGGQGDDDFQQMLNEHRKRFYREIVENIGRKLQDTGAQRIILAGAEQTAHDLYNLMDERMQQQVVTIKGIPMYTGTADILNRAQGAALEFERKEEFEIVDQVINLAKAGGRGALGRDAVLEALDMQRVELLVLVYPFVDEEWGNEMAFRALQLNSSVELVHGEAASLLLSHAEGGVGARLYYAL